MAVVTIDLPEHTFDGLGDSPEEFAQELRLAAAIFWYSRGEISQGKGALIAGLSRREFLEALGRARVDAIQIDDDDLKNEVERDLRARRERLSADHFARDKPLDLRYHAAQLAGTARLTEQGRLIPLGCNRTHQDRIEPCTCPAFGTAARVVHGQLLPEDRRRRSERAWPPIAAGEHVLLVSPTGTGKTLAAFLAILDRLFREHEAGTLAPGLRCVYVSPLRSLSYDVEHNLKLPLDEIRTG